MKDKITLLDGYSLIYRTYFAFMRNPLVNREGKNVSVIFGFFNTLFKFFNKNKPARFAVILDSKGPTFRHELFSAYKANREKAPDDLHAQIPIVEEILMALGIPTFKKQGLEADDIIATIATKCSQKQISCDIITGDKDLLQLVDDYVAILKPGNGEYTRLSKSNVVETWGVSPALILDLLSLTGDSADNIPGVTGVGPKGALKMLLAHPSLDEIYDHLDELTPGMQKKMEIGRENAFLSRDLIRLKCDADFSPSEISFLDIDRAAADSLFLREDVLSLISKGSEAKPLEQAESDLTKRKQMNVPSGQPFLTPLEQLVMPEASSLKDDQWDLISDLGSLDVLLLNAAKSEWIAIDLETNHIDDMVATPVGFSFCFDDNKAWYLPLRAGGRDLLDIESVKKRLKIFFEQDCPKIVGQNFKYDYKVLTRWGIHVAPPVFDTGIAAWMLDSNLNRFSLDFLANRVLNYQTIHYKDIVPKGATFDSIELEVAAPYAAEDALITWRLWKTLAPLLVENQLESLFYEMEMPLVEVLAKMEMEGIFLNKGLLSFYSKKLGIELEKIEKEIFEICGKVFNIKSTKQLQQILFDERGLTPIKKTKTGFSTDTSVLKALSALDPVPNLILHHRRLSKLKSTYTDTLGAQVNEQSCRLHTHLNPTGTATGRLSSRDPNLQNIPVKDEEGRMIRRAFQAAEGNRYLSADYSQIELAVLASLADEPALKSAFLEGIDIHRRTAALIFQNEEVEVTPEQRRTAKIINFGVMYGMSSFRLAKELSISIKQAASFITSYFDGYQGIRGFIDKTVEKAQASGKVMTEGGHFRFIKGINSLNKTEQQSAQRVAVNTPIQGTAAEIVKRAMLAISKRLEESGLKAKMILQIHDELLFELPANEEEVLTILVREEMEKAAQLSIPIKISIESGLSWGDFH